MILTNFQKLFVNINSRPNTVVKDGIATRDELLKKISPGGKKIANGDLRKTIYK